MLELYTKIVHELLDINGRSVMNVQECVFGRFVSLLCILKFQRKVNGIFPLFCYFHVIELNEEVCLYSAIISGKIQQLVAQNDNANQHLENTSLRCARLKMLILKFCTISKQELDLNTDEEENFLIKFDLHKRNHRDEEVFMSRP